MFASKQRKWMKILDSNGYSVSGEDIEIKFVSAATPINPSLQTHSLMV